MIGLTISAEVGWPGSAIALKVAYASALQAYRCQAEAFNCVRCMRPGARSIWQQPPSPLHQPSLHPTWPCDQISAVALSARTTGNVSQPLTQAALTKKKVQSLHDKLGDASFCPARYNPTLKGG